MHETIKDNPDLIEEDFEILGHEVRTDHGARIDILGKDNRGEAVAVEVKDGKAGIGSVRDLKGYVEAVEEGRIEKYGQKVKERIARGILAAPKASKEVKKQISNSSNLDYLIIGED